MVRNRSIEILTAAGVSLALLSACGGGDAAKDEVNVNVKTAEAKGGGRARSVSVVTVERRALEGGVIASGALVAREEAVVAAEVTGFRVARVAADVGDQVRAGQVLVQLDSALLTSQVEQQTAMVAQAEVAARQAAAQAQRVTGLEGTGALAGEQIEQRRFQAESATAALNAQRAALQDLRVRLSKMEVRAPVGGVILERNVRAGELSGGGAAPMFRIVRDNQVELQAEVPEASLRSIQRGAPVSVSLPSGQIVQGRVRIIEPLVRAENRLGLVRISLPVRADLRPGGSATAQFSDLRGDVLAVPETAINYDADGASVFVVGAGDKITRTRVAIGRRGGGYAEIVSGLSEGAVVLQSAGTFVLEGDVVNPVRAAAQ